MADRQFTIDEIEAMLKKITPPPWRWDGNDLWHEGEGYNLCDDPHLYCGISYDERLIKLTPGSLKANIKFIKDAPNIIRQLLDEIKEMKKMNIKTKWKHGPPRKPYKRIGWVLEVAFKKPPKWRIHWGYFRQTKKEIKEEYWHSYKGQLTTDCKKGWCRIIPIYKEVQDD